MHFYMNMQLDVIFAVILNLMNVRKMKSLPHISSLAFQNNCGYRPTKFDAYPFIGLACSLE